MLPNFVVGAANVSNHPNVPRVSVIIHFANVFKCFTVPIVGNVSNVDCMRRNLLSHRGVAAGLNFLPRELHLVNIIRFSNSFGMKMDLEKGRWQYSGSLTDLKKVCGL